MISNIEYNHATFKVQKGFKTSLIKIAHDAQLYFWDDTIVKIPY